MFTKREQIRDWVKQYLQGILTYDEFMDEFIRQTWDLYEYEYPEAREIANWVDNIFIRYSEDFIDESELREKLEDIVIFNDLRMLEALEKLSKDMNEVKLNEDIAQALFEDSD